MCISEHSKKPKVRIGTDPPPCLDFFPLKSKKVIKVIKKMTLKSKKVIKIILFFAFELMTMRCLP